MGGFVTELEGLYMADDMMGQNDGMTELAILPVFSALSARAILELPSPGNPAFRR